MTLDEAIQRFEKLASDYEFNLDMHQRNVMKLSVNDIERMKRYAQENRQLVKWLEELRLYRLHYDKAEERIAKKMKESSDYVVINNKRYVSYSELCEILEGKDILKEGE